MTEAVKVTQADRDFVFEILGGGSYADMIARGEADFDQFVQRTAAFRIAAATRMRERAAECADVVMRRDYHLAVRDEIDGLGATAYGRGSDCANSIATAIRTLPTEDDA